MPASKQSLVALRERFAYRPLVPNELARQRSTWCQRWGLQPPPVHTESTRWAYHVDPAELTEPDPLNPWSRLRFSLLNDTVGGKSFLTGTKGVGKSTTLNSLWRDEEVRRRFHLLGFSILDYLNLAEADASQIVAVMIAHLVEEVRDRGRMADLGVPEAQAAIRDLKKLLKKTLPAAHLEGVDIKLFGVLTAKFKASDGARKGFRDFMDGQPEAVFSLLAHVIRIVEQAAGKPVLMVIDDLDKLTDASASHDIFQGRLHVLVRPASTALYTFPLELHRDPRHDHLTAQPNRYKLSSVKLFAGRESQGSILDEGRRVMRRFIECRLGDGRTLGDCLDETLFDCVLRYSCGNFRELNRILQHGLRTAAMFDRPRLDTMCLKAALGKLRQDYDGFRLQYAGTLKKFLDNQTADEPEDIDEEKISPLIRSLAIVEHPNGEGWRDIHPIIRDLIDGRPSGC